jgi:hypothetical protein
MDASRGCAFIICSGIGGINPFNCPGDFGFLGDFGLGDDDLGDLGDRGDLGDFDDFLDIGIVYYDTILYLL